MLSSLMETQKWWLPVSVCWVQEGINKEAMDCASTSVWKEASPVALTSKPNNCFSPYIPGNFCAAAPALELRVYKSITKQVYIWAS